MELLSVDTLFFAFCAVAIVFVLSVRLMAMFRYHSRKKFVGPAYWGDYQDNPNANKKELETIKLQQPSLQQLIVAGSAVYSKGQAVKSLRR